MALLDRDRVGVERTAAELGAGVIGLAADVTDAASLQTAIATVVERFGGIDVLVANAGITGPSKTVSAIDPDAFEQVIDINLLGVWRTVRAGMPHIVERRGYVLVVASLAALWPIPMVTAYSASKAGVEGFSRSLGRELAPAGTQVGVAYFGVVDTEMEHALTPQPGINQLFAALPGPLGGKISPSEAAAAIVRGIERRSARVFAPKYIRVAHAMRSVIEIFDPLIARSSKLRRAIELADGTSGPTPAPVPLESSPPVREPS